RRRRRGARRPGDPRPRAPCAGRRLTAARTGMARALDSESDRSARPTKGTPMTTAPSPQARGPRRAPSRFFGLRPKLALGFGGLLAILLAGGLYSIALLDRLGGSIDVILRENYESVLACEQMKEALERLDSAALFSLAGDGRRGRELAAANRPRFEKALKTEL